MTLSKSATLPGTPRSAAAGFSMIELVVSLSVMFIDTAPSPTEKQLLIAGFVSLVTAGAPAGPNIAGGGALTMLSASVCTHACFAFDARGAVSNLQGYVMYIGGINDPDTSYRAIVLLPSGSTQVWSAPAGGPWHQVN